MMTDTALLNFIACLGLFEKIGIGLFLLATVVGLIIKLRTRSKVKKLNAFKGIREKGDTIGKIE